MTDELKCKKSALGGIWRKINLWKNSVKLMNFLMYFFLWISVSYFLIENIENAEIYLLFITLPVLIGSFSFVAGTYIKTKSKKQYFSVSVTMFQSMVAMLIAYMFNFYMKSPAEEPIIIFFKTYVGPAAPIAILTGSILFAYGLYKLLPRLEKDRDSN